MELKKVKVYYEEFGIIAPEDCESVIAELSSCKEKLPLRAILDWYMCSDPWPVDDQNHEVITTWLEAQSKAQGYSGWVEAYHRLPTKSQHKEGE